MLGIVLKSWRFLFYLLPLFSFQLWGQESAIPVKITEIKGKAYIFTDPGGPFFVAKPLTLLTHGHFITTDSASTVLLDLTTNGLVVLGPRSLLYIGARTKRGLRHLDLIQGQLYFQNRPNFKDRPPGGVITLRGQPNGFVGSHYKIRFTKEERTVEVLSGQVERYPLKPRSVQSDQPPTVSSEWDEWDDWDDEDDLITPAPEGRRLNPDELQDVFISQLETQVRGSREREDFSIEIETKPFSGKFVTRGVYNIETATGTSQRTVRVFDNTEELPGNVTEFNPEKITYDARLELTFDRRISEARAVATAWFEYGKPSRFYRSPLQIFNDRKEGRAPIHINELYLTNNWTNTDLSVGKRIFKSGTGLLISHIDKITPKDLYDPLDFKDLGNWMIRLDHYIGRMSLSYALIPYFFPNKSSVNTLATVDDTILIPEQLYPRGDQKSFTHYAQLKTIIYGFDLIFGLKYGPNTYPIYTQERDIDALTLKTFKEHPNIFNGMFGASTTFGPFNLYTEYLYQYSPSQKDDSYHTYLFGSKYRNSEWANTFGLDYIDAFLEYSIESISTPQDGVESISPDDLLLNPDDYATGKFNIRSSVNWRSHRKNILARLVFQLNDNFNINVNADLNLTDGSTLQVLGLDYRVQEGLNLRLNYERFNFDLRRTTSETRLLPFDFEVETTGSDSAKRKFDRYTLRLEYLF
jgi:hypothetical protein